MKFLVPAQRQFYSWVETGEVTIDDVANALDIHPQRGEYETPCSLACIFANRSCDSFLEIKRKNYDNPLMWAAADKANRQVRQTVWRNILALVRAYKIQKELETKRNQIFGY